MKSVHNLPQTLAQRIALLRETAGFSRTGLAERSALPLSTIDDLESGLQTFLSASQRARLSRALKILPAILKEVEASPEAGVPIPEAEQLETLLDTLHQSPNRPVFCPVCGSRLAVRVFERKDLEDNPVVAIKAHCQRCPFSLTE